MPDIAMCKGEGCPRKTQCYRYTATASERRQSYFAISPMKPDGSCEHFYDNCGERAAVTPPSEKTPEEKPEENREQCGDCGAEILGYHACQGVPGGFSDDNDDEGSS